MCDRPSEASPNDIEKRRCPGCGQFGVHDDGVYRCDGCGREWDLVEQRSAEAKAPEDDADWKAVMAMSETEIDAELRAAGADPVEVGDMGLVAAYLGKAARFRWPGEMQARELQALLARVREDERRRESAKESHVEAKGEAEGSDHLDQEPAVDRSPHSSPRADRHREAGRVEAHEESNGDPAAPEVAGLSASRNACTECGGDESPASWGHKEACSFWDAVRPPATPTPCAAGHVHPSLHPGESCPVCGWRPDATPSSFVAEDVDLVTRSMMQNRVRDAREHAIEECARTCDERAAKHAYHATRLREEETADEDAAEVDASWHDTAQSVAEGLGKRIRALLLKGGTDGH